METSTGLGDTIAAIATAPGRGGVAIVRVSGDRAFSIAEEITGRATEQGRIVRADFLDIDDGIVLAFKSPASYTGEDVVEFQCHGGTVTPRRILDAVIAHGARLARRGEFTRRAFLNGKMTYDQAEALMDLIDAKTDKAADDARAGLKGEWKRGLKKIYEAVMELSSRIEHSLDIEESDLSPEFHDDLKKRFLALRALVQVELKRARERRVLRDGALVVIAGKPNAGKSSLLNAIIGENRVIVSDVPGTTRDAVEVWTDFDGWPVRLVDTVGIRGGCGEIESEGVRRAEALAATADVVLSIVPANEEQRPPSDDIRVVDIVSKIDLAEERDRGRFFGIVCSAKTGEGMDEIRREVGRRLGKLAESAIDVADSSADRVVASLTNARTFLSRESGDLVLMGNDLRAAAEIIGREIGANFSEDLLDALFSRFCVGK